MCDYSAKHTKQRAATKNDQLISGSISTHTRGFMSVIDPTTAVCLLPGTELAFEQPVKVDQARLLGLFAGTKTISQMVARFCQVNKDATHQHHDALEFPDGEVVLLNALREGQCATVLQLPADPATLEGKAREQAEQEQRRATYA